MKRLLDDEPPASVPTSDGVGLIENTKILWNELRGLAHDHLQLAALETQRAGESLVSIIVYGLVVAVLIISSWLGIASVLVLWLIHSGVVVSVSLLIVVLLNLLGAFGFVVAIRYESRRLRFPATVQSLRPNTKAVRE